MAGEIHHRLCPQANEQGYAQRNKEIDIYAAQDSGKAGNNGTIEFEEAYNSQTSIFDKIKDDVISQNEASEIEEGLITRYLGFDIKTAMKNAFKSFTYNTKFDAQKAKNNELLKSAQEQLNKDVASEIKTKAEALSTEILENAKIKRAIELAKAEQKGKPSIGLENPPKTYTKEDAEKGEVATFTSAKPEGETKSKGYENTKKYLVEQKGAKVWKREVNGTVQEVFVYKEKNEEGKNVKKRVVIDDAGQLHELEKTKTVGKNAYTTQEASDVLNDAVKKEFGEGAVVKDKKRRKVQKGNGTFEYETIVVIKDGQGTEHIRVLDQGDNGEVKISKDVKAKKRFLRKTAYKNVRFDEKVKEQPKIKPVESKVEVQDTRISAGDYGVNDGYNDSKTDKNRVINYDKTPNKGGYKFTKQNFIKEGWGTDKNRTKENKYRAAMDKYAQDNDEPVTYALSSVTQFTELFVKANFIIPSGKKVNYKKLENAIKVANPSFFDSNGNMYQKVDFSRLNLPRNIHNYLE